MPVQSPLAGIHAGVLATTSDFVFCCPCDTPLLTTAVIEALVAEARPTLDVIVPRLGPYYQPLCALYSRRCLPVIADMLAIGEVKVDRLYAQVALKEVPETLLREADPQLHAFMNVNTPGDLEAVAALLAAKPQSPAATKK